MRINPARHHITARGVEHLAALEPLPDLDNPPALDQDIGLIGQIGGHDGAVLDDGRPELPLFGAVSFLKYGTLL